MDTLCVVVGVTFRPLNNVPQPLRCTDVRMLKDAKEVRDQKHDRNRLWGEPGNKTEANAPEYSPTDHVKRAKEKRSISVQPFGAVMHLVRKSLL